MNGEVMAPRNVSLLLQKVFSSLNEAVFIVISGTRIIQDVNLAVERMFGYTRDEIVGRHTSCLHLNQQMFQRFGEEMAQAYQKKGYYETTYRMKRKDGTFFDSEHCVTPIHDTSGQIVSHVCVVRDISERVSSENALRKLALEQGVILDNACVGITLTRDRKFVWVNNKLEEMFGYCEGQMSGQSTRLVYPSDEAFEQSGKATYETVAKGSQYVAELELIRRDGTIFWVKYYGKAIDPDNISAGTIWIVEDIQARKQAEQALIVKTQLLKELNNNLEARIAQAVEELRQKDDVLACQNRLLVDMAPEAIIVFDTELNRIVDANAKAEQLFGCSREVLFTSGPLRFYAQNQPDGRLPEESFSEYSARVMAGEVLVFEQAIRSEKGRDVVCEVRLVKLPSPHNSRVRASFFDITERLRTQKELAKALASEQRLNEEQQQFMGLISHELRTPLAIIDGTAQLLVMTACKDSDCLMHANRILSSTKRLSNLIDTCLTEERLCTSGWTPNMRLVDIGQLARDVVTRAQGDSARHLFESNLEELPEQYTCDPLLITILLNNLLDNAIKYSPHGGEISLRGWSAGKGELCLEVTDQGIGIDPEQIEKAFERFYRAWQIPGIAGAGLGLHIVKRIAELHGGTVNCSSQPGRGSTFTVQLHSGNNS